MSARWGKLIAEASGLGVTMGLMAATCVLLGLWLGTRLDLLLGTRPVLTIVLSIAGALAGQAALAVIAIRTQRRLSGVASHPQVGGAIVTMRQGLRAAAWVMLPPLVGALAGIWLDGVLGTRAILSIILPIAGVIIGVHHVRQHAAHSSSSAAGSTH